MRWHKGDSSYSLEQRQRLKELWGEGLSARLIGIEIGLTKNQVIGLAHRMELPGRPSPIKGLAGAPKRRPQALEATAPVPMPQEPQGPPARPLAVILGGRSCQFIAGEPSADDSCKCGRPAVEGQSWCEEHAGTVVAKRAMEELEAAE